MPEAKIISADGWVGNAPLLRLSLLGHFSIRADGLERSLTEGSRRLLALLALTGQRIRRPMVAGTLWPEANDVAACACLRSAVARLGHAHADVLWANATELSLSAAVHVDLRRPRPRRDGCWPAANPYATPTGGRKRGAALT